MKGKITLRVKGEPFGYNNSLQMDIDIRIGSKQSGRTLSISAGVWEPNKSDMIQCGQMQDTIRELVNNDEIVKSPISREQLIQLLDVWDRWHLNDMNAGCKHQEEKLRQILKVVSYDYDTISKIPEFKKCPKCGYQYGTSWKHERLPDDVVKFVANLPIKEE